MELTCNTCDNTFTAKRSDAKYCSPRCRTQASRDRNQPDRPRAPRRSLPEQFVTKMIELQRVTESLERLSEDDRRERHQEHLRLLHRADLERYIAGLQNVLKKLN